MPDDRSRSASGALDLLPPLVLALAVAILLLPIFRLEIVRPAWPLHFQAQAEAFLHGRLDLGFPIYDSIGFGSKVYLPFGPLPSVLMMPVVALLGAAAPLGWVMVPATGLAAFCLWRIFALLRFETERRAWLVLASLGGTVFLVCLPLNSSYFAAHVLAFACLCGALLLAFLGRAPLAAGLLVALAGLTRNTELVAALPVALMYQQRVARRLAEPEGTAAGGPAWRDAALVMIGLLPGIALSLWFNAARFGNPLESGYNLQALANPILIDRRAHGLFALRHVPANLYYSLIAPPLLHGPGGTEAFHMVPDPWGMGIVFVSPWLLAAALARGRVAALMALGTGLLLLPSLLYYGIGWLQFGYRYGLDATPFAVVLAALGYRNLRSRPWLPLLATFSVMVNLWGVYWIAGATA